MPTTTLAANKIRDRLNTDCDKLAVGTTTTTTPTTSDTVLQYEVLRSASDASDVSVNKQLTKTFVVGVDQANGFALKEIGLYFNAKTDLTTGENTTNITGTGDATVSNDSNIYQIGTKSLKITITYSSGTGTATNTTTIGDVSSITGVSSGTPTKGVVSMKIRPDSLANITSITYRVGSDSSNYASKAVTIASLTEDTWHGFNFDLSGATITGTPVWTAVDYQAWIIVATGSCVLYADDCWISEECGSRTTVPTINKNNTLEVTYEVTVTVTNS